MSSLAFTITPIAFLLTCAAAQATPADPHVIFDTAVAGLPIHKVDAFQFQTNANGGGVLNFQNVSNSSWVGVDFLVTLPIFSTVHCVPSAFFAACDFTSMPGTMPGTAVYDIGFDQPRTLGVIRGAIFSINLNNLLPNGNPDLNPKGSGGWGSNNMVGAVTTLATPEPTSLLLIGGGVALLGILRGSRKQRES